MEHVGDEKARFWLKVRIGLVAALFGIGFVVVVGRVYYLQTAEAEALKERIASEREGEVTRQARRGDIRDRNGTELAVSVEVPSIYGRPALLGDRGDRTEAARRLAEVLEATPAEVEERLDTDSPFVWLERQTHPGVAERIEQLEMTGVGVMTEYDRYYPMGELAGQLLGFVGTDGEGLEGIERQYDDQLAGDPYEVGVTRDATGEELLLANIPQFDTFEGHSVHLTIDEKIQRVAQEALDAQIEEYDARGGHAVVMDVHTGEVLAMANRPEFDPNRFEEFSPDDWRLGVVTDTFEPGSVFKPFLVAGALQEQVVSLDTMYDLEDGQMRVGGYTIGDVMRREELTVAEIIQKSSNIGSYKIGRDLGRERFYDYIRGFGFGSRTGIGLRGEQPGVVWPPEGWAEIEFANISFGQGLSATPIQLAAATAALANGGRLMEPSVVGEVRTREGETVWEHQPTMARQVISQRAADQIAEAMSMATHEEGTGTAGDLEHFTVAAKTGTAQQVDSETGQYDPDGWVSGYIGFVPAEAPEVAIAVFVDEPQEVRYGGAVAGPAFAEIAEEALSRRGTLPVPGNQRFEGGDDSAEIADVPHYEFPGDQPVEVPPRHPPQPVDVQGEDVVPILTDLTLREAVDRARQVGMVPRVVGSGVVVEQHPPPGTPLEETAQLELTLAPPSQTEVTSEQIDVDQQQ